jgi:hypothetical protein
MGAIGSGAWEYILKPVVLRTSSITLEIATLGIKAFKDSVYKEIAQGHHEAASLGLFLFVFGMLPGMITGAFWGYYKEKSSNESKSISNKKPLFSLAMFSIFIVMFATIYCSRVSYVNRAVTNYNQLLSITRPYISQEDMMLSISKFSQIANKNDYVVLIDSLSKICVANHITPPTFTVW